MQHFKSSALRVVRGANAEKVSAMRHKRFNRFDKFFFALWNRRTGYH